MFQLMHDQALDLIAEAWDAGEHRLVLGMPLGFGRSTLISRLIARERLRTLYIANLESAGYPWLLQRMTAHMQGRVPVTMLGSTHVPLGPVLLPLYRDDLNPRTLTWLRHDVFDLVVIDHGAPFPPAFFEWVADVPSARTLWLSAQTPFVTWDQVPYVGQTWIDAALSLSIHPLSGNTTVMTMRPLRS